MLRKIRLYGKLAQEYAEEVSLDVSSVAESIVALNANFPGFLRSLKKGHFYVLKGDIDNDPTDLGKDVASFKLFFNDDDAFHIMPALEGAGGNGFWTAVAGVVLIVVGIALGPYGGAYISAEGAALLISSGISLTLAGISTMIAGNVQSYNDGSQGEKENPSFIFNGPVNRTEQGGPVTLVFGKTITGSIVGGGSIDIEDIPYEGD